jgi:two-component system, chemotaxis family, sensor kinase CheA
MTVVNNTLMLEAFQEDALEIIKDWELACVKANSTRRHDFFLAVRRCAHNLKGNAGLIGFNQLKDSIHRLEERLVTLDESKAAPAEPSLLVIFFEIERFLREWIKNLVANPDYKVENLNVFTKLEAWVPSTTTETKDDDEPDLTEVSPEALFSATEAVRIPAQKLDALIQQIGELTLTQAIVSRGRYEDNLNTNAVKEAIAQSDKLVRNLRLTVLDLRMLPMIGIYSKLERAAMELSMQLKKPLQFLAEGQDVAFDKAVMARIFDPLLHLVRNAIDHGLETTTERAKKNKPPNGTIQISSSIVPSGVQISLKDDGQGLDYEKILRKAVERGLISKDQKLNDHEISNLIFEPGFSTAEKVTDVSGRGIGLDIVKKELLNLGGQLEIKSTRHMGTEFIFTLPTNVSLIDVLVIRSKGLLYCVPTQDVAEILNTESVKIEKSALYNQMTKIRDRVMPIEPISKFLAHGSSVAETDISQDCILIIHYQNDILGLRVDSVLEQQQVFVRPLKGYLSKIKNISGSTVLSNGEPSLIINVKQMADEYFEHTHQGARLGEFTI